MPRTLPSRLHLRRQQTPPHHPHGRLRPPMAGHRVQRRRPRLGANQNGRRHRPRRPAPRPPDPGMARHHTRPSRPAKRRLLAPHAAPNPSPAHRRPALPKPPHGHPRSPHRHRPAPHQPALNHQPQLHTAQFLCTDRKRIRRHLSHQTARIYRIALQKPQAAPARLRRASPSLSPAESRNARHPRAPRN